MTGNREPVEAVVRRVVRMERCFDEIRAALETDAEAAEKNETIKEKLRSLLDYYENGQWLADYGRDSAGELPANLKRGVLSEDGVWNLLTEISSNAKSGDV